jgi:hypothetical protein
MVGGVVLLCRHLGPFLFLAICKGGIDIPGVTEIDNVSKNIIGSSHFCVRFPNFQPDHDFLQNQTVYV